MKKILIATAICTAATQLWASGFQIVEQGASNMGTALAGATANANADASAAFWNPSAAFFVKGEEDFKIDSSLNFIIPDFRFEPGEAYSPAGAKVSGSDGGNAGGLSVVPNFYAIYKISEDWRFTLSLTSPFGLQTKYSEDFVGRYHGIKSNVTTIDLNPSIAYRVFDWWTVSAGASAQFVSAELTQSSYLNPMFTDEFSKMSATGWSAGFNLGMTFKYDERGRIAVGFRSQVSHSVSGSMKFRNPLLSSLRQDVTADVSLPNTVNVGLYQRFYGDFEDFAVMVDYAWTQWSSFKDLTVLGASGNVLSTTDESWKDTSRISLGMHYYATDEITLRAGTTWDESPIRGSTFRTPRIPDANRLWIAGGIGYNYNDWLNFEVAYAYIIFDASYMNNQNDPAKGVLTGSFSGAAHVVSAQVGIRF